MVKEISLVLALTISIASISWGRPTETLDTGRIRKACAVILATEAQFLRVPLAEWEALDVNPNLFYEFYLRWKGVCGAFNDAAESLQTNPGADRVIALQFAEMDVLELAREIPSLKVWIRQQQRRKRGTRSD